MGENQRSNATRAWTIIAVWFVLSILIFSLEHDWGVLIFAISFGVGYGGVVHRSRFRLKEWVKGKGHDNFAAFAVAALSVSIIEEFYVFLLGDRIAVPNIWLDIVIVPAEWLVWFSTWFFFLSRRYRFRYGEALLTAGFIGLFYEYFGNLYFIRNLAGFIISIPVTVIVYAAIFILPMQFIDFSGEKDGILKYPISVILPYILTIPVAVLLYVLLL